jgi:FAD/FMN-containing dehydrogenase/SAM-dependent methyltransferase
MGGQTASPDSLHLDLREMNRILKFDPQSKIIHVQAGVRWCDIQAFIDPHGLAVKIMQTYANFTVGGALSVNAHGRYIGLGPVVMSVRSIVLVLADGEIMHTSPIAHSEFFYAAIGGYGAIGVITEVELDLVENVRVERHHSSMQTKDYPKWFDLNVRHREEAIFHNADLYPPKYASARAVSWMKTDKPTTTKHRLQPLHRLYPLEKYFMWAISETPLGKFRRQFIIDPLLYLSKKVYWRNFEAGYDAAELEPLGRERSTYVLQEYFVPYVCLLDFVPKMTAILSRYDVNMINVSIRHALADPGTVMAWARGETFAFVLYYKQKTNDSAKERVGIWTRELIEAAIECGGTYYLPYQPHATHDQFHRAYPRAKELFALKKRLDPEYRLRGALWDKYYATTQLTEGVKNKMPSLFQRVYQDTQQADRFYAFLKNIFHLYPEDQFHSLIKQCLNENNNDELIYRSVQARLPSITPPLSLLTYALPALIAQKEEIGQQTARLIGKQCVINDYVEIGSTGRYVRALRKHLKLRGGVKLVHDKAAGYSAVDIVERGQIRKIGTFVDLNSYAPLELPENSADLISCYVGLHHMEPEKLLPFLHSIARALRPGGYFILRDHDVTSEAMNDFVGLAHCVFNAGLAEPWENNAGELRHFASAQTWIDRIESVGLMHTGEKLLQNGDPSDNVLMAFQRRGVI